MSQTFLFLIEEMLDPWGNIKFLGLVLTLFLVDGKIWELCEVNIISSKKACLYIILKWEI